MKRAIILMYHIIDDPRSESEAQYCCPATNFEKQMRYLDHSVFSAISLDDYMAYLQGKQDIPDNPVIVTFDDGFQDFYSSALPIAKRHNIPLTLFMVARGIDGTNDWMHKKGKPKRQLLTKNELLECANSGVTIGSHTSNHPKLPEVEKELAIEEISQSKKILEEVLGREIKHFAYPHGMYNPEHKDYVKNAGYDSACSTRSGFNRNDINPYELRRIEVYGSDSLWQFKQKLKFGCNEMSYFYPLKYYTQRLTSKFVK